MDGNKDQYSANFEYYYGKKYFTISMLCQTWNITLEVLKPILYNAYLTGQNDALENQLKIEKEKIKKLEK